MMNEANFRETKCLSGKQLKLIVGETSRANGPDFSSAGDSTIQQA